MFMWAYAHLGGPEVRGEVNIGSSTARLEPTEEDYPKIKWVRIPH